VRAAACDFRAGFRTIHDLKPDLVGACLEDEHHNVQTGDTLQATTRGLLVWRKADNWTAFTNGSLTWVYGPYGLQSRANNERFPWEADLGQPAVPDEARAVVQLATADAALKGGADPSAVRLLSLQPRDWPNASLGCPQPGQGYAQVVTRGYLIILEAAGKRLEYHTDLRRADPC
jgi:hypothetical protein